ncbi:MAG: TRAP transporter small permease [Polaromonas sp.]|uniref:TRAP transporter small permease n=1 Tax=Polaromonas sp. TaxID=1869339 RepID=UPI002734DD82|nr:TRAP transporter small permease [Polaromonas sp.]MDP2820064.1 TRAP transporter small permease [Polaromonas sp.]
MTHIIDRISKFLEFLIALGLALMVVLVFGNVVLRYGFNSGITVSEEVSRWLFIWGTFLGAIVALREHGHLGVDLVVSRLPAWGKKLCLVVGHLVMMGIVILLFKGSLDQSRINWDVSAPTTGFSMAIVSSVGCVFAVLAMPLLLFDLWRIVTGQLSDDELVMIQESEEAVQLQQLLASAAAPVKGGAAP